jgi:hypothetical protein
MGSYSFLVGWDRERGAAVGPELEAKYYVPLFWMAMFDPGDIRDATVDGSAFARPPNATESFEDTTYAYCEPALALERLKQRSAALGAATSKTIATKFTKFAQVYAQQPIVLRLSGLADSPVEFVKTMRDSLAAVADPTTSPDRLRMIGGLGHGWENQPYAENLLIGWGTALTVRERELAKRRRSTSKTDRAERDRLEVWRAAIAANAPEHRKRYSASSAFAVDDVIDHVKFGPGVVVRLNEKTKIDVQFEDGMHVLAHKPL